MNGVTKTTNTTSYYIESAMIHMFSHQGSNTVNTSSSLLLTHYGVCLTLAHGTQLQFPVLVSNNLLFMITSKSLKSNSKCDSRATNLCSLLASSTYTYFWSSSVDMSQAVLLQPPIDQATILCDNINLPPSQKELLLWHYRLVHIGL